MSEENFPSWRYGPDGEARVCDSADDVPKGWSDHPSKVAKKEKAPAEAKEPLNDAALAAKAELSAARKAHKEKFGKLPGPRATLDEINAKLAAED